LQLVKTANRKGGPTMNIAEPLTVLKKELLENIVPQILDLLQASLHDGRPLHHVEAGLWDLVLRMGHQSLDAFLASHGTGDLGETLTLPEGRQVERLDELHPRRYVSIFGAFQLLRTAYGSRAGQALEFVPLDNRLQLPQGAFSHLLQDWDQSLAMEQPFGQVNQTIQRMLKLNQSVDSLEGVNRQMAQDVATFRDLQGSPPAAEEGQIVVVSADGKGVVIRGQGTKTVCGGRWDWIRHLGRLLEAQVPCRLVHNLHAYARGRHAPDPYDWAVRFEAEAKAMMVAADYRPLLEYEKLGPDALLSIPTPEHYLPLLYVLGTRQDGRKHDVPDRGRRWRINLDVGRAGRSLIHGPTNYDARTPKLWIGATNVSASQSRILARSGSCGSGSHGLPIGQTGDTF
jgi:hypothetical protein